MPALQPPSRPSTHRLAVSPLALSCFHLSAPPALESQAPEGPSQSRAAGYAGEPRTHTWAGDGGESPGVPAASQATDTNPHSDLLASAPTVTTEVCSLWLYPVRWPRCLVQLPAGLPPSLVLGPAKGRPGWGGAREHGRPPQHLCSAKQCHCQKQCGWWALLCGPSFLLGYRSLEASDPISGALAPILVTWKSFCSEDSLYKSLV